MSNTFKKVKEELIIEEPIAVQEENASATKIKRIPKPIGAVLAVFGGSFLTREYFLKQIP